jgi:hypothetical protein
MKPERIIALIAGGTLITIGVASLFANIFLKTDSWQIWPIVVVLIGLGLTAPGFLGLSRPGFGGFFIPGIPVLITGGILMFASLTNNWGIWAVAWPLVVLALSLGFILAGFFMRVPALAIPAAIIGVNGLVLGFCAVTGMWQAWAILWPIEPLSVGIGLLILGIANRSQGVKLAAIILFSVAGGGFFITSFFSMFNETILRFAVPGMLIITGTLIIISFLLRQPTVEMASPVEQAAEAEQTI